MSWFWRWVILVTILTTIAVLAWWFIFVDRRPDHFWEVLLYTGAVAILIGGLMIIGNSPSSMDQSMALPYLMVRKPGTGNEQTTEQIDRGILWWLEASPAIWAFVLIGIATIAIGFVLRMIA